MNRRGHILVVDDDGFSRTLYANVLEEAGHDVVLADGGPAAIALLHKESFDAVITDLVMPEAGGLQVLEEAQAIARPVDVIIVTGHGTVRNAVTALRAGAFDYISKPVDPDELRLSVQRLLSQRALLDENRDLKSYVGLFRRCQALASCLDQDQIQRLAIEALVEEMGALSVTFLAAPGHKVEERAARGLQAKIHRALAHVLGGDPLAYSQVQTLEAPAGAAVSAEAKLESPLGPSLVIPVRSGTTVFGALFVGRAPGSAPFGLSDLGKADFFGKHVGLAIENATKYREAKQLAFVDDLTELYNVRYLNYVLDKEIKRSKRYHTPLAVLFLDLDYFKGVNDRHGHVTGSRMLIEVAAIIKRCIRDTDVLVRYGGDEYTVLLPSTDSEGAMVVAERMRASIEKSEFRLDDGTILRITASIGVACYPEHAREKKDILKMADAAMYHGKATSRNVVYLASALLDPAQSAAAAAAREQHASENRRTRERSGAPEAPPLERAASPEGEPARKSSGRS